VGEFEVAISGEIWVAIGVFGPEKSKRISKVLHYFSHANNIERLAENNELIFDIEAAVKELIDTIRVSDPLHMEALEAAVAQP
jgi:hypothetical protein